MSIKKPIAPYRKNKTQSDKRRPPHTAEDTQIVERRAQALALRRGGATYRQIGRQLGVSVEVAYADVQAELHALRTLTAEDAEAVRDLELRRLDDYVLALSARAKQGDVAAISTLLRVQERRAKYLGLDAPDKQEILGDAPVFTLRIDRGDG
jgi:hypothetical protein